MNECRSWKKQPSKVGVFKGWPPPSRDQCSLKLLSYSKRRDKVDGLWKDVPPKDSKRLFALSLNTDHTDKRKDDCPRHEEVTWLKAGIRKGSTATRPQRRISWGMFTSGRRPLAQGDLWVGKQHGILNTPRPFCPGKSLQLWPITL